MHGSRCRPIDDADGSGAGAEGQETMRRHSCASPRPLLFPSNGHAGYARVHTEGARLPDVPGVSTGDGKYVRQSSTAMFRRVPGGCVVPLQTHALGAARTNEVPSRDRRCRTYRPRLRGSSWRQTARPPPLSFAKTGPAVVGRPNDDSCWLSRSASVTSHLSVALRRRCQRVTKAVRPLLQPTRSTRQSAPADGGPAVSGGRRASALESEGAGRVPKTALPFTTAPRHLAHASLYLPNP
jgi:hypothetical protein